MVISIAFLFRYIPLLLETNVEFTSETPDSHKFHIEVRSLDLNSHNQKPLAEPVSKKNDRDHSLSLSGTRVHKNKYIYLYLYVQSRTDLYRIHHISIQYIIIYLCTSKNFQN